jgi:hypothetical protein
VEDYLTSKPPVAEEKSDAILPLVLRGELAEETDGSKPV